MARPRCPGRVFWLLAVVAALGAGCSQGVYRANRLPTEFLAPATVNLETVNLCGLAEQSVGSESVQPGDVLDVSMVTDFARLTTTTTPVRVAEDGSAVVPLIGRVQLAGLEMPQAEQAIAAESVARGVFRTPAVTVTMRQRRKNRVTVVGAVNDAGVVELERGASSLLQALVRAGGLSKEAGSDVEIRRTGPGGTGPGGPRLDEPHVAGRNGPEASLVGYRRAAAEPPIVKVNLEAATKGAQRPPELLDGDVVYVAKRSLRPVYVLGLVRKPGEFPYPINQELRVLDALALAGGVSNPVAENVLVIRQIPDRPEPVRIAVGIQAAKNGGDNLRLAPGDTVTVEQTAGTVVLDTLQNLVRFGFSGSFPIF